MADRIEVHQLAVARAAEACRSTGADGLAELTKLLSGLTRSAFDAAAGHDDYSKQIVDGWVRCGAEQFPEFAKEIELQLISNGDSMSACGARAAETDCDAAQQVRAADIGLTLTDKGWSPIQSPPD